MNKKIIIKYAKTLSKANKQEEAKQILFKANYENPSDKLTRILEEYKTKNNK